MEHWCAALSNRDKNQLECIPQGIPSRNHPRNHTTLFQSAMNHMSVQTCSNFIILSFLTRVGFPFKLALRGPPESPWQAFRPLSPETQTWKFRIMSWNILLQTSLDITGLFVYRSSSFMLSLISTYSSPLKAPHPETVASVFARSSRASFVLGSRIG